MKQIQAVGVLFMSIGILRVLRALLLSLLLSAVCLLLLAAFAITRESPEALIAGCGRATFYVGALLAGFLGAKGNGGALGGVLTAALLLVLILACAPLFPGHTEMLSKWILLAIALACGLLGAWIGGKRRTKVVRRKRKSRRGA